LLEGCGHFDGRASTGVPQQMHLGGGGSEAGEVEQACPLLGDTVAPGVVIAGKNQGGAHLAGARIDDRFRECALAEIIFDIGIRNPIVVYVRLIWVLRNRARVGSLANLRYRENVRLKAFLRLHPKADQVVGRIEPHVVGTPISHCQRNDDAAYGNALMGTALGECEELIALYSKRDRDARCRLHTRDEWTFGLGWRPVECQFVKDNSVSDGGSVTATEIAQARPRRRGDCQKESNAREQASEPDARPNTKPSPHGH